MSNDLVDSYVDSQRRLPKIYKMKSFLPNSVFILLGLQGSREKQVKNVLMLVDWTPNCAPGFEQCQNGIPVRMFRGKLFRATSHDTKMVRINSIRCINGITFWRIRFFDGIHHHHQTVWKFRGFWSIRTTQRRLLHGLETLKVDSESTSVYRVEVNWFTCETSKMVELMLFETYDVPALLISPSAVLDAYAANKTTCLIVDLGASHTSIVPVRRWSRLAQQHCQDRLWIQKRICCFSN
jgi:hypothetical protein